ncbi:MAG TPA: ribosome silencing factor [Thermomicrobiaceae bacterium]|nr:ribosome silencing factor [Thermomicrobiaceae bacterium]
MIEQEGVIEEATLARQIAAIASDTLASDILVLDIQRVSSIADYFVICSTDNPRQLRAVADQIQEGLRDDGTRPERREGMPETGWVVLDYGAVIVHLFTTEQREFYRLEDLWSDAQRLLVIQ